MGETFFKRKSVLAILLGLILAILPFGIGGEKVFAKQTASVEINGYQISSTVEGFRTVYSVVDPNHEVLEAGMVYGLTNKISESDMVAGKNTDLIHSQAATDSGKSNVCYSTCDNAQSYFMTMEFIKNASFYCEKITTRAYAKLADGSYIYSDIRAITVYEIADYLYQNRLMTNAQGHNYLYDNILNFVDSGYQRIEFKWDNILVRPEEKDTTKVPETTVPKPTEPQTTAPQPTTQQPTTAEDIEVDIPNGDKATGAPAAMIISHDNWDKDGDYILSGAIWYGNNATRYVVYEKKGKTGTYKAVATGTLEDDSPQVQKLSVEITGKTVPGTYWYYIDLINQYGTTKTNEISVDVGGVASSKIVIGTIDDDEIVNQHIMSQGTYTYDIDYAESDNYEFKVISSNTTVVKASIVNGKQLKLEAIAGGRTGIKLVETKSGEERYFGIRVKEKDGSLAAMPSYLAIGQVSEDSDADLKFWKDTSNDDTNKRMDVRYIYINGGPINGWQSWSGDDPGKRVQSYITESLKLGIVPYFVYYNIPDGGESYFTDTEHMNDKAYMEAYYKDLTFFLETCKKYDNGENIGIILEPDFIGYMMQNSGKKPADIVAAGVEGAYSSGVLQKGVDPDFPNTMVGLVESINYIISTKYPSANFGWQFNTWSYANGVPGQGLMHSTEYMGFDAGRNFIKNAAVETANYYMSAGILSYGADFISIDKYGLDGAYQNGAAENPKDSQWLWNSDLWNNYLYYTKTLHETTKKPVTLWQIPVGHLNHSLSANPYTGTLFPDLTNKNMHYEDSAPTYFFGDTFEPGSSVRMNYFGTNAYNDKKVYTNGNAITYESHMQEAADAGVTCILFGAGVGDSTDAVGYPPTDDYWWITKAQRYYQNPIWLPKN